jgi:steroid delta-isomerase-like uncharacterized protein
MSDTARNKEVALRFYDEFWNKGNPDAADEIVSEDIDHGQMPDDWPTGREGFKRLVRVWREAFPDMTEDVDIVLADGDWTASRFTLRGTHRGDFYGIAATGRRIEITGVDLLRFEDGRIVEWIYNEDALGLFAQLGQFPADLAEVAGPSASD